MFNEDIFFKLNFLQFLLITYISYPLIIMRFFKESKTVLRGFQISSYMRFL